MLSTARFSCSLDWGLMPLMVVFEPKALSPKRTVSTLRPGQLCFLARVVALLYLVKVMVEIYVQVMGDYIWDV